MERDSERRDDLQDDAAIPESVLAAIAAADESGIDESEAGAFAAEESGAEESGSDESEAAAGGDESPPDFWSAEDKALWGTVPAALRPVLRRYESQRVAFANRKAREAAQTRAEAAEMRAAAAAEAERHAGLVDEAARWWAEAAPALQRAFADKWSQVKWKELAESNPAEWTRLNQQRLDEATLLAEAERRGEADRQAAAERAERDFAERRRLEQQTLAERLPAYFGNRETAQRTYETLGRFLLAKGIPADRINAIHEAPIIELVLDAWRFEQAQLHARQAREGRAGTSARPTPTRIAPGPGSLAAPGHRGGEAGRPVAERFRTGGGASLAEAAELIRLSGL